MYVYYALSVHICSPTLHCVDIGPSVAILARALELEPRASIVSLSWLSRPPTAMEQEKQQKQAQQAKLESRDCIDSRSDSGKQGCSCCSSGGSHGGSNLLIEAAKEA